MARAPVRTSAVSAKCPKTKRTPVSRKAQSPKSKSTHIQKKTVMRTTVATRKRVRAQKELEEQQEHKCGEETDIEQEITPPPVTRKRIRSSCDGTVNNRSPHSREQSP